MLEPCKTAIKSVKHIKPKNTKYKYDNLRSVDSSSNDKEPIIWNMRPKNKAVIHRAKWSNIIIVSADGALPKTSEVSCNLKSVENKLNISGRIWRNPIAITILNIFLIFIYFIFIL